MREFLEKLRQQPDAEKRGIAFFGSCVVTTFVVTSLLVLPSPQEKKSGEENPKDLLSPLDAITHSFSLSAAGVGENLSALKETLEDLQKDAALAQVSSSSPATSPATNTPEDFANTTESVESAESVPEEISSSSSSSAF